jgi:hypothetical protein
MTITVTFEELEILVEAGTHRIAAGTLQHGNIVLTDEDVARITEYDALCTLQIHRDANRPWVVMQVSPL